MTFYALKNLNNGVPLTIIGRSEELTDTTLAGNDISGLVMVR